MTDAQPEEQPTFQVSVDHMDAAPAEEVGVLLAFIEQEGLANEMVTQIASVLPDPSQWRLILSGDVVATVNSIEQREVDNSYTMDRGSGHVGAKTIAHDDGTHDFVIWSGSFFLMEEEPDTREEFVDHVLSQARHLALHEAGHGLLHTRGEQDDAYQDLVVADSSERAWRKFLAAHIDDHRIEQMTRASAPSRMSSVGHIGDAIAHFRAELNASSATWRDDLGEAQYRTLTAANDLLRVVTYLSAELGLNADGSALLPDPLPDGWDEYLAETWDMWSRTLHRLKPASETMTPEEIAAVLTDLCRLTPAWMRSIGVDWHQEANGDGYIYWTNTSY